ncbi:potassium/sodium hyperpolarization-activated cyclic nucleotide-gated channel 2-like isoform X1 [Harmonia axyridis]|uniref:potassium/sodium hyperpolarization-activated cyclic nucleotide-gated channel 2-like isoform X1 n=1 Tax=Harmonia axyridis TaxID=115357 RepID=UPI001E276A3B|nr:potassium/sodium hyperpolarization-activated cyclic nucleotide-gated channel 2-like isoform X1 [Harmonia axyridis]XP_045468674.1 potassium/sodium hyperpolarization-activated cyclic nucleotide-gated channel 2-like isoform X1 [Harmonia axyridis]
MKRTYNWFTKDNSGAKNEFAKYGHTCEIPEEMDDVAEYYSPETFWNNLAKKAFQLRTVSDISKSYTHHLRSHGAIMKERKRHLIYHNYIIHPYSYFRVIWEMILSVVIYVQLILVPLHSGFCIIEDGHLMEGSESYLDPSIITLDFFLCTDVVINLFTGYYSEPKKEVILDLKHIFLHYLKSYLIPDVLSSLPTNAAYNSGYDYSLLFLKLLSLLKMLRFITFVKYYTRLINFFHVRYSVSSLLLLLIGVGLYWHSITCYLIFVKLVDEFLETINPNLLPSDQPNLFSQNSYSDIYVSCFYKASMIIYTSWYTQENPGGLVEYCVVTIMWFCSKAIQFFILARTLQIMKGVNSSHQKYVEMERQLKEYMRDKQLPTYMRTRLLTYYDYRFQRNYFRESEILATISGQLRQEIIMHSCRQLVENVAFFKNLPLNLLVRIVSCLRGEMYLMNDVIVRANTPGDCMYFIASGTVAIYSTSGKEICHLEDGSHFGEIALVNKAEARIASVVAIEICEVYRFDVKDFVRAIHPYPDLLDSIEKIASDRMEKTLMLDEHNRREMAMKRVNK